MSLSTYKQLRRGSIFYYLMIKIVVASLFSREPGFICFVLSITYVFSYTVIKDSNQSVIRESSFMYNKAPNTSLS